MATLDMATHQSTQLDTITNTTRHHHQHHSTPSTRPHQHVHHLHLRSCIHQSVNNAATRRVRTQHRTPIRYRQPWSISPLQLTHGLATFTARFYPSTVKLSISGCRRLLRSPRAPMTMRTSYSSCHDPAVWAVLMRSDIPCHRTYT